MDQHKAKNLMHILALFLLSLSFNQFSGILVLLVGGVSNICNTPNNARKRERNK
jgi:hypothetical protein